ncbi:MAG: CsbD family protein [Vicinamibacterales bacterium]
MPKRDANSRWQDLTGAVRERWSALTEEDVLNVRGNAERLIDALQARYGFAREEAIKELNAWSRSLADASPR